jgi:steroid delta-isomerase
MRSRLAAVPALAGAALILFLATPAAAADPAEAEIRAALERWTADFNAGRADAVCDLFAPDLVSRFRGAPVRDHAALCQLLQRSLADPARRYSNRLELLEVIVSGDLAAVRLVWHGTVRDLESGTETHTTEPGLDIFRRQPDGRWRIARFLAFAEEPD